MSIHYFLSPELTETADDALDTLANRAPATDNLIELATWLQASGAHHLSPIERIELAERLISRRRFLIGAGALGLGLMTGCGPAAAPTAPATRGFVDVTGQTVQIPVRPARIVATHDINAGAQILSLGGPLVGISSRDAGMRADVTRYFDLSEVTDIGITYQPNLERIAALQPDLIVHEGFNGAVTIGDAALLSQLQAIAPVVGIDTFRPVEQVMADVATLLGDAATVSLASQRAEFEGLLEELRAFLGPRWSEVTCSMIAANGGALEAWGPTALVPLDILSRLGVDWVPLMQEAGRPENGGYLGDISLERLDEFNADLALVTTAFEPETLDTPLFQQLPVVQAGQTIELGEQIAGTHYPNYSYIARLLLDGLRTIGEIRTDLV